MDQQAGAENKYGIVWGGLCTLIVIMVMIFASEYLKEWEIIFPEAAALAVGLFLAPKLPWRTDYLRLLFSISLCAVLGELIVLFVPAGQWVQMSLAYVLSQLVYLYSGTTLTPMISAMLLPVLLQTRGYAYPLSVLLMCTLLILLRTILIRAGIQEGVSYEAEKLPRKQMLKDALFRCIAVVALLYIALAFGVVFAAAPPLLVAFTELVNPAHPARKRLVSVVELVVICSLAGALARYYLGSTMGLPLYIAVIPAILLMIVVMYLMKLYFPPAGAMLVLPFLLMSERNIMLYPGQVLIGMAVFALVALRLPQSSTYGD